MKKLLFFVCFAFVCLFVYANDDDSAVEVSPKKSEYFLMPTLGFGPLGVNTSLDVMYRHQSGFGMLINFNIAVPLAPYGGIIPSSELYLGYVLKKGNFYTSFVAGIWVASGVSFYGEEVKKRAGNRDVSIILGAAVLGMVAVRNDYIYFFNDKVGINFSHTHGLGIQYSRYFIYDEPQIYSFWLKMGVAVRI